VEINPVFVLAGLLFLVVALIVGRKFPGFTLVGAILFMIGFGVGLMLPFDRIAGIAGWVYKHSSAIAEWVRARYVPEIKPESLELTDLGSMVGLGLGIIIFCSILRKIAAFGMGFGFGLCARALLIYLGFYP